MEFDKNILDDIINEFKMINEHPRKSGHEKEVSDYLFKRFNNLGFVCYQDEVNNVIAEKKVNDTDKFIILQGHMDMVCSKEDDKDIDFLTDTVSCIIEGNKMHADRTTIGADDGIGLAIAIVLMKNIDKNIRVICTVDEEDGMNGAINLDSKYLDGEYLINIDWEDALTICNSSAGGKNTNCYFQADKEEMEEGSELVSLSIKGLPGGHSGADIHLNIPNAIRHVAFILKEIISKGIEINLAKIDGGFASNAIAQKCEAVFSIDSHHIEEIKEIARNYGQNTLISDKVALEVVSGKDLVFSKGDTNKVISFLTSIIDGVNSFSTKYEGIVESSANIGVIATDGNKIVTKSLLRSCEDTKMDEVFSNYTNTAESNNFTYEVVSDNPAWPIKDSKILDMCLDSYKKVTGNENKVCQVHAGLECSYFAERNKDLDMISVGPSIEGAHTPKETIYLDTIMPIYEMIKLVMTTKK